MNLKSMLSWLDLPLLVLLFTSFSVGIAHAGDHACLRVPELDPGQMVSGIALLIGGAAIFLEKMRARRR
jgi:hypothetical protein